MPKNQSNRGGSRRSNNNNPDGRNQYSGFIGMARERPATAAVAAAGVAAAGVFLWSKRAQISDQLYDLSDQISEWTENMWSDPAERELALAGEDSAFGARPATGNFGTSTPGRATASRTPRPSGAKRASATSGIRSGSGTMSGGSLDTGPSGRSEG